MFDAREDSRRTKVSLFMANPAVAKRKSLHPFKHFAKPTKQNSSLFDNSEN